MKLAADLIRTNSIEEMCLKRERAIELFDAAVAACKRCNDSFSMTPGLHVGSYRNSISKQGFIKGMDRECWRHILKGSGLERLMSARQRESFFRDIENNTPEFTADTVRATFGDFKEMGRDLFIKTVVEVFQAAPREFKSNDAFHLGRRMVIEYAWDADRLYWREYYAHSARAYVRDLDRVHNLLDGKTFEGEDVTDIVARAMHEGKSEASNEYMRIKWFKKGTMHIYFQREDLIREMNRIIAGHYGAALAA